jgi:predicted nucleic acid-binding protein
MTAKSGFRGNVSDSESFSRSSSAARDIPPAQGADERDRVLVRKAKISPRLARTTIIRYRDTYPLVETSSGVFLSPTDLAVDHKIGIWDAVMFAAAAEAGCRLLLSEDLQEGFT